MRSFEERLSKANYDLTTAVPKIAIYILIALVIVDMNLATFFDILDEQLVSTAGLILFITTVIFSYGIGQFYLLKFARSASRDIRDTSQYFRITFDMIVIVQYLLTAILAFSIIQMLLVSSYYSLLIVLATLSTYSIAALITGFLSYKFLFWYKKSLSARKIREQRFLPATGKVTDGNINKKRRRGATERSRPDAVVLLYGLAFAMAAINTGLGVIFQNGMLISSSPIEIIPRPQVEFPEITSETAGVLALIYLYPGFLSLVSSFILFWAGTAILLRQYSKKIGKIRYWILIFLPLVVFLSSMSPSILGAVGTAEFAHYEENLLFFRIFSRVAVTLGGILFGLIFLAIAYRIGRISLQMKEDHSLFSKEYDQYTAPSSSHTKVKMYLMASAYGSVLITMSLASPVIHTPYPPIGLAASSYVAMGSFLLSLGLYSSAISVSKDVSLRQSIRKAAREESGLLDRIGIAQMHDEIENRVAKIAKQHYEELEKETGVKSSYEQEDVKQYIEEMIVELHKEKRGKEMRPERENMRQGDSSNRFNIQTKDKNN